MARGRPPKDPSELHVRLSITFSPQAYVAMSKIARLTQMSKAQICSWAVVHLWREIQEEQALTEE